MSNVHENWAFVSDAVAEQVKKNCGCGPNEKLRSIHNQQFKMIFKTLPPEGRVVWRKEIPGNLIIYKNKDAYVFTDPDGTNAKQFHEDLPDL